MQIKVEFSDVVAMIKSEDLGECGLGELLLAYCRFEEARGYNMTEVREFANRLASGQIKKTWEPGEKCSLCQKSYSPRTRYRACPHGAIPENKLPLVAEAGKQPGASKLSLDAQVAIAKFRRGDSRHG